jgi:acyl transferase domain-containing protein/NADPH:quinone reductase-like Zn-dependent oxidoreductase/short-subunit dehydrogenase/acyl carrier protein
MACRLPGAPDLAALDRLLDAGGCAVSAAPRGRWSVERFRADGERQAGLSYSFAGGYLEAPFAVDPAVFGISPREAVQMDPQQRILLEVVWEALEDAGLAVESIAGSTTGVYIGASGLDHASLFAADPAAIDAGFMTGNTLSVLSNRISHVFDLRGPSFTIDTACSSSLVALAQAVADLQSGRVERAIVGGVNLLLSPVPFIGFSAAAMLSPTGLCRPFSSKGDGYVRAEGAVAIVLTRDSDAVPGSMRARLCDAQTNSDGRTSGIALPRLESQVALLERIYTGLGLSADSIAFVEAHGTGTRVGDPIEAAALSRVLGRGRAAPLPIGSIKSNIGHPEPASGLAGLIKAVRALERRNLPATLHVAAEEPLLDFEAMGLMLPLRTMALADTGDLYAGVSSFGFGGTNAHAVLQSAPAAPPGPPPQSDRLVISAASEAALRALAGAYATELAAGVPAPVLAAAATARSTLAHRLVLDLSTSGSAEDALVDFSAGKANDALATGRGMAPAPQVCFIFPGNGLQYAGMGRAAYERNTAFRAMFDAVSRAYEVHAGWSIAEALGAPDLDHRLERGIVAQPMVFAVQAALAAALDADCIRPDLVLGHSLGEVAAAHAAGLLSLTEATGLVHARATVQERAFGRGTMAVAAASRAEVEALGADIDIAAENGPRSTTLSGDAAAMADFSAKARARRIAVRPMALAYPFHSRHLDDLADDFHRALPPLSQSGKPTSTMVSTVTGSIIGPAGLDGAYWWRNMREPVAYRDAILAAAAAGATLFMEIGSRALLLQATRDSLAAVGLDLPVLESLSDRDERRAGDPVRRAAGRIMAHGGGPKPVAPQVRDRRVTLPHYPWQRQELRAPASAERIDLFGTDSPHPLLGPRLRPDATEWRQLIDITRIGSLADHRIEGDVVVPGSALLDLAMSAARALDSTTGLSLCDFDLVSPLMLPTGQMRELRVSIEGTSGRLRIESRRRFDDDGWVVHAQAQILDAGDRWHPLPPAGSPDSIVSVAMVAERALAAGLHYGPSFQRLAQIDRTPDRLEVTLTPATLPSLPGCALDPASLDSVFQALLGIIDDEGDTQSLHVPVRFGTVRVFADNPVIASAGLARERSGGGISVWTIELRDQAGSVVAGMTGAVFRLISTRRAGGGVGLFASEAYPLVPMRPVGPIALTTAPTPPPESWLLLRAYARRRLAQLLRARAGKARRFDPAHWAGGEAHAAPLSRILRLLADDLVAGGLARPEVSGFSLLAFSGANPRTILRSFIVENPRASADLALTLGALEALPEALRTGRLPEAASPLSPRFLRDGLAMVPLRSALAAALDAALSQAPDTRLRILLLAQDAEALLAPLLDLYRAGRVDLGIAGSDPARRHRLIESLPASVEVVEVDLAPGAPRPGLQWDMLVLASLDDQRPVLRSDLLSACRHLQPDGLVVAGTPGTDPLLALLLGRIPPDAATLARALQAEGLLLSDEIDATGIICLRPPVVPSDEPVLRHTGTTIELDTAQPLPALLMTLRAEIMTAAATAVTALTVVYAADDEPTAEAIAAFLRVARQEFAPLALRFIHTAPQAAVPSADPAADDEEIDLRRAAAVPRLRKLTLAATAEAHRLDLTAGHFGPDWTATDRPAPRPGEVEIAVTAIGLNFRDVMLAGGLLPVDLFDGGFAGAAIGFEYSGSIARIGDGVTDLAIGTDVAGVAPGGFRTHVRARRTDVMAMPDGLGPEAAASLPVAFLTAWHALIDLAAVRPGERVLIHGGAGGVGLAALQIARNRGARVLTTASTPTKRALALAHGAEAAYESRSLDFAADIRRDFGGVDVVLNSLSGAAMQHSLRLLSPFGRFIELGKRDFAENTALPLRPMRENIAYFGVDLDQVLQHRPDVVKRGLSFIGAGLTRGTLTPLPVVAFDADEVKQAFALMRQGGHIGKVVIRPPAVSAPSPAPDLGQNGVQLIIGGTQGFGFETAVWLDEQGCRTLVLASRRGTIDPTLDARVAALRQTGVQVVAAAVDITVPGATEALVGRLCAEFGPISGVVHSALHLEDGLVDSLSIRAIERVLAPKVAGILNLSRALENQPLRHFTIHSSLAATLGNPGQAAYAAANAFLEGFARARRAAGMPCLAVAWGPIRNTGIMAEASAEGSNAARVRLRSIAMSAADALNHLGRLLSAGPKAPPVAICADLGAALALLPSAVSQSPRLDFIRRTDGTPATTLPTADLATQIADLPETEALSIVRDGVIAELARILRMLPDTIDPRQSLDQLGLDSLMAVEFKLGFEGRFGIDLPLMSLNAMRTPEDIVRRIVLRLRGAPDPLNAHERLLFETHRAADTPALDPGIVP